MLYLGETGISKLYLGETPIAKAYLGESLVWSATQPLPYDAEVEYLESTGTQWIDTGVYGAYNRGTEIDFAVTSIQSEKGIFGCLGLPRQCLILASDYFRYDLGPGSSYRYPQTTARRVVSYNPSSRAMTDSVYGVVGWDDYYQTEFSETPDTMTIFADKRDGAIVSASRITSMRLYGFRVWDSSGNLLDVIPVRFTNELGQSEGAMYDRVSGQLFRNQGTGDFTIGPDKQ